MRWKDKGLFNAFFECFLHIFWIFNFSNLIDFTCFWGLKGTVEGQNLAPPWQNEKNVTFQKQIWKSLNYFELVLRFDVDDAEPYVLGALAEGIKLIVDQ